jgi:hypothetical protein
MLLMNSIALIPEDRAPPLSFLLREAGALVNLRWKSLVARMSPPHRGGEGRPVMVIPGLLSSDRSTVVMRRMLRAHGYRAYGWSLGINRGVSVSLLERAEAELERVSRHGPVTLIGWSLGGLYAREIAKRRPDLVERVITLGSPFSGDVHANNAWRLYEMVNDHKVTNPPIEASVHEKPPVPTIALWSRKDGIVAPASARGAEGECDRTVEVDCSHIGFMAEPCALEAVLRVLKD